MIMDKKKNLPALYAQKAVNLKQMEQRSQVQNVKGENYLPFRNLYPPLG